MKYSEKNPPIECIQTNNRCYKHTIAGKESTNANMKVLGVLWHSTGANNPNIKRYVQPMEIDNDYDEMIKLLGKNKYNNDWNHTQNWVAVNAWIGKLADGSVSTVQALPWTFRPWGCGGGKNGSCNDGFIQFEIAEDSLASETYAKKVYDEACELTAYLCELFDIDPEGTVEFRGVTVPTILCHYDSHKLGLGSNHGDIDHWLPKYGYTMETARKDVAKLLNANSEPIVKKELYRVRKEWDLPKTQIGAYSVYQNAVEACDAAGEEYKVFDSTGLQVYPLIIEEPKPPVEVDPTPAAPAEENKNYMAVGEIVKLRPSATWHNMKTIPNWVRNRTLYVVKELDQDGKIGISMFKKGPVTGYVYMTAIDFPEKEVKPYIVIITEKLNVRKEADRNAKITAVLSKGSAYTIIAEKNGFGKLKSGAGYIDLRYTRKV